MRFVAAHFRSVNVTAATMDVFCCRYLCAGRRRGSSRGDILTKNKFSVNKKIHEFGLRNLSDNVNFPHAMLVHSRCDNISVS